MELKERMARWRLILGQESDEEFEKMGGGEGIELSKEQWMMDQALAAIYNNAASGGFGTGGRGAGLLLTLKSPDGWGMCALYLIKI